MAEESESAISDQQCLCNEPQTLSFMIFSNASFHRIGFSTHRTKCTSQEERRQLVGTPSDTQRVLRLQECTPKAKARMYQTARSEPNPVRQSRGKKGESSIENSPAQKKNEPEKLLSNFQFKGTEKR